jgi:glycosyltransferase involved in cell wall biosynthesis
MYTNTARSTSPPIKIEAVTTCVDYSDFLAHTLPLNLIHFDRLIVVTSPSDVRTRKVCETHGIEYCETNKFAERHDEFKKGYGINEGLRKLDRDSWIVHLDSDIILPAHFRQSIARADLDTLMIYGCDRAEFKSFADWQRFHGEPEPPLQGNGVLLHTSNTGHHIGTRVQFPDKGGWIPIGFFQMWHADSKVMLYPEGHTSAGREDSSFATQWPRRKRSNLGEIIAYHLESEAAPMAVNWSGRKTVKFHVDGGSR